MLARLRSFVDVLLRRGRFERIMYEEMRLHLELRAEDLQRPGLSRDDARRVARLEFGGIDNAKDDCRQARGVRLLDELDGDMRYATRLMAKTPGFSIPIHTSGNARALALPPHIQGPIRPRAAPPLPTW